MNETLKLPRQLGRSNGLSSRFVDVFNASYKPLNARDLD